VKEEVDVKR